MRTASSRRLRFFIGLLGLIAAGGALLGSVLGQATPVNALVSTIDALLIFGTIVAIEVFLPHTRHGRDFERSPFLVVFLVKSAVYLALIALEIGFRAGRHLVTALIIAGNPFQVVAQLPPRVPLKVVMMILTILIPFVVLVVQISRLVGEGTLRDIACGRYHRPRAEERIFLFVDVAGSTALAERIGPSAAHRFLRRVFLLASEAVDDHGGEIHQYVGDEMVVTWTLDEGARGCAPVSCYFAIERALAAAAEEFRREFGAVPRLRAALHAGTVIAGEVGSSRRAIATCSDPEPFRTPGVAVELAVGIWRRVRQSLKGVRCALTIPMSVGSVHGDAGASGAWTSSRMTSRACRRERCTARLRRCLRKEAAGLCATHTENLVSFGSGVHW